MSYFHGVRVKENQALREPSKARTLSKSTIAILCKGANWADFEPSILKGGSIPREVQNVVDPTEIKNIENIFKEVFQAKVIVFPIQYTDGEDETKVIDVDATFKRLGGIRSEVGENPGIIISPSLFSDKIDGEKTATISVDKADRIQSLCSKINAIAIISVPFSADISSYEEQDRDRIYTVLGETYVKTDQGTSNYNLSPYVAGLLARVDADFGLFVSPSNKDFNSLSRLTNYVPFGDDVSGDVRGSDHYNERGHALIVRNLGKLKLWGSRITARREQNGVVKDANYLNVIRTKDAIADTLEGYVLQFVDQGMNRRFFDNVTQYVNDYLSALRSQGAIVNGKCWVDEAQVLSSSNIKNGKAFFVFDFMPAYPAEQITLTYRINVEDYIGELTGGTT